jgi:disulfide bond formation protein DsbB
LPKPPFTPKAAGRIGFFFGPVAGAFVSAISLRRMGRPEKAKKVIIITSLAAAGLALVLAVTPDALSRIIGLGAEAAFYFIFPRIQDQEFAEWEAANTASVPSSGWKAIGWGFIGVVLFILIVVVVVLVLGEMGVPS